MNTIFVIAFLINLVIVIIFFAGLFKIATNTRESAEHLGKIRQFLVELRDIARMYGQEKK